MTPEQIEGENKEYERWRLSLIDKNTGIISPIDAWLARAEIASYKGIHFFCKNCGKEIWEGISEDNKKMSISEAEYQCVCSDCTLKRHKGEEQK